jgi:tRNA(adenine34) deaminase
MTIDRTDAERWMRRCLQLAEQARARGDAAVGAVIVRAGEIIAEGVEGVGAGRDVTAHAELIALRAACERLGTADLSDCVLCTNVEPCWMCSYLIREAGISAVMIGVPVADIGGLTSRYPLLSDDRVEGWGPPPAISWVDLTEQ